LTNIFIIIEDRLCGVLEVEAEVVSFCPSANIAHVEPYNYCIMIERDISKVFGNKISIGILTRKGVV